MVVPTEVTTALWPDPPVGTPLFEFVPKPKRITKQVKYEWKTRHRGKATILEKAKDRKNVTIIYILEGSLTPSDRYTLDYSHIRQGMKARFQNPFGEKDSADWPLVVVTDAEFVYEEGGGVWDITAGAEPVVRYRITLREVGEVS